MGCNVRCPSVLGNYVRDNKDRKYRCIEILLKHGAHVPAEVTPPVLAIHRGDAAQLGELLDSDLSLLTQRHRDMPYWIMGLRGATLLHCAVEFGEIACAEELFKRWADINMKAEVIDGIGGQTPIFHAINTFGDKNFEVLEYLVKRVGPWIDMSVRATWQFWDKPQPKPMTPLEYAEYGDRSLDMKKWRLENRRGTRHSPFAFDQTTQIKQAIVRKDLPAD